MFTFGKITGELTLNRVTRLEWTVQKPYENCISPAFWFQGNVLYLELKCWPRSYSIYMKNGSQQVLPKALNVTSFVDVGSKNLRYAHKEIIDDECISDLIGHFPFDSLLPLHSFPELTFVFIFGGDIGLTLHLGKEKNENSSKHDKGVQTEALSKLTDLQLKSSGKLQTDLEELLSSEKQSDVIVKVKSQEFKVHRLIVAKRSPVFEAMFEHEMSEKQTGVAKVEDCDPDTFPDFLKHIYTGKIEVSSENARQLYKSADFFEMMELKEACLEHMKTKLTVDNFCDILTLSLLHSEKELTRIATEFFLANSSDIVLSAKWLTFLKENLVVGNELIIKALGANKSIS